MLVQGITLVGALKSLQSDPQAAARAQALGIDLAAANAAGEAAGFVARPQPVQSPAEAAARAKSWIREGDGDGVIFHPNDFESWKAAVSWGNEDGYGSTYGTWEQCCEDEGISHEGAP